MTTTEFIESLAGDMPPINTNTYLKALWYERKGDWEKAHELVMDIPESRAAWVHAYLHRREGDQWNADYWYGKAGQPSCTLSLEEEWKQMVKALLEHL